MKKHSSSAFTLIELLVVITIIAILAGLSLPVFNTVIMNAQMTDAMNNARQIGIALKCYGNDNGGNYPTDKNSYGETIATSNDAFRSLIPTYLDNEKVFTVSRSKAGPKCDNKMEPQQEILKAGENHFAYISGVSTSSNSLWPLIVDSTDGSGHYTKVETDFGGTWKGTKAVVVRADASAALVPLQGPGTQRFIPRAEDSTKNALEVADYMGSGARVLEPARP